jgi:hypothetical protein
MWSFRMLSGIPTFACLKCRYSSYGRHFSQPPLLQAVAEILEQFMRPNDVVVDYSCGANEWVPMVKRWCHRAGFKVGAYLIVRFRMVGRPSV